METDVHRHTVIFLSCSEEEEFYYMPEASRCLQEDGDRRQESPLLQAMTRCPHTVESRSADRHEEPPPERDVQKAPDSPQDVVLTDPAPSEDTDTLDQGDEQQDQQTVCPPAETSSTETKWEVGAQCRAVWSEDGQVYQATVVSVDAERCRVRFSGYGNEEEVELSTLQSPDAAPQMENPQDWRPGSRCRAVYSEDGLVYPAVVLWVTGQRCRVRFDDYNNEEEQDVSSLLCPDELHGPSRTGTAKGGGWKSSPGGPDWRRRRREGNLGERGGERRSGRRDDQQNSSTVRDGAANQSRDEKDSDEKRRDGAERPANHSVPLFPPFPPPQSSSGDPLSFLPPPPLWSSSGKESGGSPDVDSMLMLWYMCGFHTGSYMTRQMFQSTSKD
ncbi:survival motor neuron protein-like isoform X2 [Parambassis ranga]|uniref:Survival motor neuron protein-like isoform X2 n=1 Tax=Parambassis ranga TaxID=210632 RepID=A0A6P7HY41_9TELE|nr:survival motor neuron protein-like isoform X2 [Parambassis ranga]